MDYFGDGHDRQSRVLFVDGGHARPCASILRSKESFTILLATDGRAALDILRHHDVDIIVVDEGMPDMAAPYLFAAVQELSPATAVIVLTSSATDQSVDQSSAIHTLPISCSEQDLRAKIERLLADMQTPTAADEEIDPREALADALLSQDDPEAARHAADLYPDFARTMTEQELAATDVLDSDGTENSGSFIGLPRANETSTDPTRAVIVFSADPDVVRCVAHAAQDRFLLFVASNIVQAVKLLRTHAPGVLVTDIAEDRNTIATMTERLKQHVPALVTVAISARRDPAEMAWLINHGHIFRFLRKPVSIGRCAVCLHAALQHHDTLRATSQTEPKLARSDDSGVMSGVFEKLKAVTERLA